MKSKHATLLVYVGMLGLMVSLFMRGTIDGVVILFGAITIAAIFLYAFLETREIERTNKAREEYFALFEQTGVSPEVDNSIPLCSTCHAPMNTPGCSTSPESKIKYPNGFHTFGGGCTCSQDLHPL